MIMTYVIEKGVPIPQDRGQGHRTGFSRALRALEVGDSMLVPEMTQNGVSARASSLSKITGQKFITRRVEGGIRIWRVS